MKFRFHRELLKESMETVIEVSCLEDVKRRYNENNLFPIDIIKCVKVCFDERIDWDTYMIIADGFRIGYADGELK
jgi:hypothetical protein